MKDCRKIKEELSRIRGVLKTIISVNHDIFLIQEQDRLLNSICKRIAASAYRLVWIGLCDKETRQVIPQAQSGFGEGYLKTIKVTYDNTEYSKGPTGIAIKSKKPSIVRFIASDPRYLPWRKQALKRGYKSSAAIPIFRGKEITGVLNVYSEKEDAFGKSEIAALKQLSRSISIAFKRIEEENRRKLAEEQLRKTELKYKELFEKNPDGIAIADIKTLRFFYANSAMYRMLGYSKEEFLKLSIKDIHPRYSLRFVISKFKSQPRLAKDIPCLRKDRSILYCDINTTKFTIEGRACNVGVFRDITARKQLEETLDGNRKMLHLFIEHAPAPIAMFDAEMRYLAVSRRFLEDYNLTEKNIIGKSHYDVFPEIPERWKKIHRRCLRGEKEKCAEDPFPRANGTLDWIRWECMPWYEQPGKIGGIILFSEVITERKKAEKQIKDYTAKLEEQALSLVQKNAALQEMIAQIEIEKDKLKEQVVANVEVLLLPLLKKLSMKGASKKYSSLLENNLKGLVSSFGLKMTEKRAMLTPKEIEICNMIKGGLSSKDISGFLNTSYQTIEKHRKNIRKKFSLSGKDTNLVSFLRAL